MTIFHDIELEIVRPGPSHNQLLSPLTVYTALCGESAPVNFSIDLEHRQLIDRISRLRYIVRENGEVIGIAESQRQVAVDDMGEEVGKILEKIKNLLFEQGRAFGQTIVESGSCEEHMVHLRMVSSAAELANIPFEIAVSPAATPGEGKQMLLDLNLPVVLTREIRRTRPLPVNWDRNQKPRVLIIAAEPGFLDVPLNEHVRAIRRSLEPWVGWPDEETESPDRMLEVKKRISILNMASLEEIYKKCSEEQFTHIHILVHGGEYDRAGEKRFGLVLCDHNDKSKKSYVSGSELAQALQAENFQDRWRSSPSMVTLATCDSGAQGAVTIPGGSIAYDLHVAGIPWVLASQFPLSKKGSTVLTQKLYPRIFGGEDPRRALFELRRILYTHVRGMHDWASLVVYASVSEGFNEQVLRNFENQMKSAINTAMARADNCVKASMASDDISKRRKSKLLDEADNALKKVHATLQLWEERLVEGRDMANRVRRAEYYGIAGSAHKRAALIYKRRANSKSKEQENSYQKSLKDAMKSYEKAINEWAMDESKYHWVATQYLSLNAVSSPDDAEKLRSNERNVSLYLMAKELAQVDLRSSEDDLEKAWACGTLAELELLSPCYNVRRRKSSTAGDKNAVEYCQKLVQFVGPDDFAVWSTFRQFSRYKKYWANFTGGDSTGVLDKILDALSPDSTT